MATGGSGVKSDLLANSGTANNLASTYDSNALGLSSALAPQLETEAAHPAGFDPATMAAMTTSAEQTAGGGAAAGQGEAALRANRTRNIGSGQAAGAAANRGASQDLSQINEGLQVKNANLKNEQQQAGLKGEQGLYGTDVGAGENALGLSDTALSDAGKVPPSFWQQFGSQAAFGALKAAQSGGGGGE